MKTGIRIAILRKMYDQLCELIADFQVSPPLEMSKATQQKMLGDMHAQLEALWWAHNTCVDTFDEGEHIPGVEPSTQ